MNEIGVNLVLKSEHIYFGIDNMEIMHQFHRGDWIPRDVVIPLKRFCLRERISM